MDTSKKSKTNNTGKKKFSAELTGLILILISIIGIGVFGPVGNLIKQFAIFLVGTYCDILILVLMIL